jgi:hypothetical protein
LLPQQQSLPNDNMKIFPEYTRSFHLEYLTPLKME